MGMKLIKTGNCYRVFEGDLKVFNSLPAGFYRIGFGKMTGFSLEITQDIAVTEKIYGVHESKVNKILTSFKTFERNLGVILSGDKGIGKSICAKLVAIKAVEQGIPCILCNEPFPGLADFIGSIDQEVMILFDEFDKTFGSGRGDDGPSPQTDLLTLFDGVTPGKKLFVITCNKLSNLNEFLVNRPGRFHYHLRFDYPTPEEIREYLHDKLKEEYWKEIDNVVSFALKVSINYDCLRAIAFEINTGITFAEAIKDLNIINYDNRDRYSVIAVLNDGSTLKTDCAIDFFSDEENIISFSDRASGHWYEYKFDSSQNKYDAERFVTVISGENITLTDSSELTDETSEEEATKLRATKSISYMTFKRKIDKSIHYNL